MDIDWLFMGSKQLQGKGKWKGEDNGLWICLRLHDEKADTLIHGHRLFIYGGKTTPRERGR